MLEKTPVAIPVAIAIHTCIACVVTAKCSDRSKTENSCVALVLLLIASFSSYIVCTVSLVGRADASKCATAAFMENTESMWSFVWHLLVAVCFTVHAFVNLTFGIFGVVNRQAHFQLQNFGVHVMTANTYFLMATRCVDESHVDVFGRPFYAARYVCISHTAPFLLVLIAQVGSVNLKIVMRAYLATICTILTGWIASDQDLQVYPGNPRAVALQCAAGFVVSCASFGFATISVISAIRSDSHQQRQHETDNNIEDSSLLSGDDSMWSTVGSSCGSSHRHTDDCDREMNKYGGTTAEATRLAIVVFSCWILYPVIWVASALDLVSPSTEVSLYSLAELLAKLVCTNALMHGSMLMYSERTRFYSAVANWRLSESARQESRIISYVFHELRNPYNGIAGHVQLLEKELDIAIGLALQNVQGEEESSTDERDDYEEDDFMSSRRATTSRQQRHNKSLLQQLQSARRDVGVARLCSQLMGDVLDSVRDLREIEVGNIHTVQSSVELLALCRDLLAMLGSRTDVSEAVRFTYSRCCVGGKETSIDKMDDEQEARLQVVCDQVRLRQILLALLTNAQKRNVHGPVELRVIECEQDIEAKARVRFEVRDCGKNLARDKSFSDIVVADTNANIFEPKSTTFSAKVDFEGNGGEFASRRASGNRLLIASKLVSVISDDSIHIESPWKEDGSQGACFYFTAFFDRADSRPKSRSPRGVYSIDLANEKKVSFPDTRPNEYDDDDDKKEPSSTILLPRQVACLIVDDLNFNNMLLERAITKMPPFKDLEWTVEIAWTGEEALDRVVNRLERYDVIFMDENFSSKNGVLAGSEATAAIREAYSLKRLPTSYQRPIIISTSGNCTDTDVEYYRSCGIDFTIGKPLPIKESLARKLVPIIKQHRDDLFQQMPP